MKKFACTSERKDQHRAYNSTYSRLLEKRESQLPVVGHKDVHEAGEKGRLWVPGASQVTDESFVARLL
jgi:hypothetical protein